MKKHVLITGANGFIGQHMTQYFLYCGFQVSVLTRQPVKFSHPNLSHIICDLSQNCPHLPTNLTAIIHTAAQSPGQGVTTNDYEKDNVIATGYLIQKAIESNTDKLIFTSSISLYGDIIETFIDEKTPVRNPEDYGDSKLQCEQLLLSNASKLPSISMRLPGVLGPRAVTPWLAKLVNQAVLGKNITIYNPKSAFNNAVHINDLTEFVEKLCSICQWDGNDTITLAARNTLLIHDIAEIICKAFNNSFDIDISNKGSFTISSEKAITKYGYNPMSMQDMLQHFILEQKNLNELCVR